MADANQEMRRPSLVATQYIDSTPCVHVRSRQISLEMTLTLSRFILPAVLCVVAALVASCAAVVPLESATKHANAKAFQTLRDRSNVYVVRTCSYGQRLHDVSVDGGVRISLACETFTVLAVVPGDHSVAVFSTENREVLRFSASAGQNYFVEMGWRIGSGTGDVKVTVALMNPVDGTRAIKASRLISSEGY